MATDQLNRLVHDVRRVALRGDVGAILDGELVGRYVAERDEAAFAELVRRHGGMVLGVCRRVVGNLDDANDAFQATFLVLARKAAEIAPPDAVGNWLYGVAYRTALDARKKAARRHVHERQGLDMPDPIGHEPERKSDLLERLDEEIEHLPEMYRTPIVLCDLEGRSRAETAAQMNIPEGTLSSRLATARKLLADRLSRRGVTLSASAVATLLASQSAQSAPPALVEPTTHAALAFTSGGAPSPAPSQVTLLAEGVIDAMFTTHARVIASWIGSMVLLTCAFVVVWRSFETPDAVAEPPNDNRSLNARANPSTDKTDTKQAKKEEPKGGLKQGFSRVHVKTGKVTIRQTEKSVVEVEANPFLQKSVDHRIENGTLYLTGRNPAVTFRVETPELSSLKVEGVSQVHVVALNTKRLEVTLDGVAKVTIAGVADQQVIVINGGAAQFDGMGCKGKKAEVTINNAGSAIVNVSEDLKATIPGPGRLEYLGTPKVESRLGIPARLRARDADAEPRNVEPAKKEPAEEEPVKPGSIKITAKVDGYTQGTQFNTQKYPFKYTSASRIDPDQLQALAKPGDVPDAIAKVLLGSVLWPGMGDILTKAKLKSDGKKINGEVEVAHKYGKQGTHMLKFKLEATLENGKLALRAVEPIIVGTWDWGGGMIKLVGKVDITFDIGN